MLYANSGQRYLHPNITRRALEFTLVFKSLFLSLIQPNAFESKHPRLGEIQAFLGG